MDIMKRIKKLEREISQFMKIAPPKPDPLPVSIVLAKIEKIEDSKHKDGRFRVQCIKDSEGMYGWLWHGMLLKDLYRAKDWYKILPTLKPLYLAMHGGWNTILSVDVWYEKEWHRVWDAHNDFDSFAQAKKDEDRYNNSIINEGKKIAKLIDQGKSFKFISSKLKKSHSINTYAWSFAYGFSKAKNKKNKDLVRNEYNLKNGGTGKEKGAIHPGILTIGAK